MTSFVIVLVVGCLIFLGVKIANDRRRLAALKAQEEWESAVEVRLDELRDGGFPEAGDARTIGVPPKKNEIVYGIFPCERYMQKTVMRRVQYAGPQFRIKIAKGLYFKAADFAVNKVTEDVMDHKGTGFLVVTNKRAVFNASGHGTNWSKTWASLMSWDVAEDQIIIEQNNGKPQVFDTSCSRALGGRFVDGDPRCAAFILTQAVPE
jgi:hypothetical protein